MKLRILLSILLFCFFRVNSHCQKVINCSGATLQNLQYQFEYSVGEICISTMTGSSNDVTQGLLQPNLKIQNPSCDIVNSVMLSFENPTRDKLRIVGDYNWITDYELFAADGKLVQRSKFSNNYINLSRLPAGMYFIRLYPGCISGYRVLKVVRQ